MAQISIFHFNLNVMAVKLLQYNFSEFPLEFIYNLQKWKYLSNLSAVPAKLDVDVEEIQA